jgi:hypothetical protein
MTYCIFQEGQLKKVNNLLDTLIVFALISLSMAKNVYCPFPLGNFKRYRVFSSKDFSWFPDLCPKTVLNVFTIHQDIQL